MNFGKTVLVTGAGGFIGSNLTRKLYKQGINVNVIAKSETDLWRIKDLKKEVQIHPCNLLDKDKLRRVVKKIDPDFIFHLAAYGSYPFQNEISRVVDVNINGTFNLLNASTDIEYKGFVVTGTSSEYGLKNKPMKETDVLEPISFYAASKASATFLSQVYAREYKKPINIIRPFSVYGPYEETSRFIPTIIRAVLKNKEISLTAGNQRRDFVYIDDVVDAYLVLAKKSRILSGEIFNIGTGIQYSNDEVVSALFNVTGKRTKVNKGAFKKRAWDTSFWVADISKAKKKLGWTPKYTLKEGLKKTYDFLENEKV